MGKKSRRKVTRYWHGGVPGLSAGDVLVPADQLAELPRIYNRDYGSDPGYVYVTTSQKLAKVCAAQWGAHFDDLRAGDLYEVRPEGELEVDPDYAHVPDLSWRCSRAVIVAVYNRAVQMTPDMRFYGLRFSTWDDGGQMYDEDGYMLPSQGMKDADVTAADLRAIGPGSSVDKGNALANRLVALRAGRGIR